MRGPMMSNFTIAVRSPSDPRRWGGQRWPATQSVFKYVDVADAHYLHAGSLKIGTLLGYGFLEDEARRDEREHTVEARIDGEQPMTPAVREKLRRFQMNIGDGVPADRTMANMKFVNFGGNHHCFCVSYKPDIADKPGKPQAVFELSKPFELRRLLQKMHPELEECDVRKVNYGTRSTSFDRANYSLPDPFVKPIRFHAEREVRFLMRRAVDNDADSIITPAREDVALLFRRIR